MKKTGAQLILEVLLEHGVDTVFGYPGGAALNVYDALYEYQDRIKHILTAHEQGASHAADGYARATGKTGVVFATSGPGATNLVTGIATAYMDSVPMVAITSNVTNNLIGRDAFQEVYITGITMPITKHNFFVNRIEDLANALRQAFRIAQSGRKGPVLVDVTKDVTAALVDYVPERPLPLKEMPKATDEELQEVADAINKAECPVIYCGGGAAARQVEKELHALMETSDIPAAHTMMAAGLVPYDDERALGMIGMHGSVTANEALFHADLPFCILLLLQHCQKVRIALYLINILLDPFLPLQGRLQGLCRIKIIMAGLPVHSLDLAPIPAALFLLLLIAFALLLFLLFCLFLSV